MAVTLLDTILHPGEGVSESLAAVARSWYPGSDSRTVTLRVRAAVGYGTAPPQSAPLLVLEQSADGETWSLLADLGVVPGVETAANVELAPDVDLRASWSFTADSPETTLHWALRVWLGG